MPPDAVDSSDRNTHLRRDASWALALACAYFVGSEVGYALSLGPSVGGTFWPPAGIALAFFLAAPVRPWPLLLGAAVANYTSDVLHGQTLPASIGFAVANLGGPLVGSVVLRRLAGAPLTFSRLGDVVLLTVVVVCVSAPLAAAVGAAVADAFTANPPALAQGWRTWWVGDAVGALVLTPFVLRLITDRQRLPAIGPRTWIEAAAFAAAVFVVTRIIFSAPPTSIAVPFLVFPVLLWGSLRLGVVAVGAALLMVVVLSAHDTAGGRGPFAAEALSLGDRLVALQIYVGVMALSFQGLATLWEERSRATAALRLAHSGLEARHKRIVEQSPLAIVSVLPDGSVTDINPAWRRSVPPHGNQLWEDPQIAPLITRAFAGHVVELPEREIVFTGRAAAGIRRMQGVAYPVKDDRGGVAEVVIIERDITGEVQARQQLMDANSALREREEALSHALREMAEAQAHREQLLTAERVARTEAERASHLKDEFLATLSHELRTPLNAIVGWAHILRQSAHPPTLAPAIEAITRNAQAQAALIEDLLDMSRIMAGKVGLNLVPTRIEEVVSAALAALQPVARARGVTLSAEIGDVQDVVVLADAIRLRQVLTNLLDNGIKFTPSGGNVKLLVSMRTGDLQIVVRDTGNGIAPEFLSVVFDRFRQADGSTTRRHGGLGLGLSIARQIVMMHGGDIEAHSDGVGQGAVFTVTLPTIRPDAMPAAVDTDDHTRAGPVAGLRIIVVDDNQDARELLDRLLTQHGCRVVTAPTAEEALTLLETRPCDVLLTDIGMPGMDGYELLRRVRAGGAARTAVVAVTAFARLEDRARVLADGFDGHVSKPVNVDILVNLLGHLSITPERAAGVGPTGEAG